MTELPADPSPEPAPQPGPAVPAQPRGLAALLVIGLVGAVAGAVLVGGAWLIFGESSGSGAVGEAPISAPAKLGDYSRLADLEISQSDDGRRNAEAVANQNQRSAERLSATYDGAAAAVESYADDRFDSQLTLLLVRAHTPFPPYVPFADVDRLVYRDSVCFTLG